MDQSCDLCPPHCLSFHPHDLLILYSFPSFSTPSSLSTSSSFPLYCSSFSFILLHQLLLPPLLFLPAPPHSSFSSCSSSSPLSFSFFLLPLISPLLLLLLIYPSSLPRRLVTMIFTSSHFFLASRGASLHRSLTSPAPPQLHFPPCWLSLPLPSPGGVGGARHLIVVVTVSYLGQKSNNAR